MTYHTPELLLIGAAANLVLAASGELKSNPDPAPPCDAPVDEFNDQFYGVPENW